jgi:hypothetical protein
MRHSPVDLRVEYVGDVATVRHPLDEGQADSDPGDVIEPIAINRNAGIYVELGQVSATTATTRM